MNPFLRILLGIVVSGVGMSMVYYTNTYLSMIGRIEWAEQNLGSGGSRFFYKILGIIVAFLGIILITNLWDELVGDLLRGIFRA